MSNKIISILNKETLTIKDIKEVITFFHSYIAGNGYEKTNDFLKELDVNAMGEDSIVAITRTLSVFSEHLEYWNEFMDNIKTHCKNKERNKLLFKGIDD
jgi:hypothetical protein